MKSIALFKKKPEELKHELFILLHEQFNLRMKLINSENKQMHSFKHIRRTISRIKTLITLMQK